MIMALKIGLIFMTNQAQSNRALGESVDPYANHVDPDQQGLTGNCLIIIT